MAGAGYKLFNTGDVLTAAQVNTYLQEQAVMVFADASARTTALSGVLAEGMITYLKSDDKVYKYTGSAWVEVGGGSSPLTTKGDLYTYSTADARLAVGTNGQYLSADSAETTGLKWVTPSSSALVKITSASFSNVATVNVDSCFTSTYRNYKVYLNVGASTEGDDLYILMRYGGTTETGLYYGSGFGYQRNNTATTFGYSGNNQATISESTGGISGSDTYGFYELSFYNVGNGNRTAQCVSIGQAVLQRAPIAAFSTGDSRTYDGFQIKSSSTNITGNYAVYGLVN